MLVFGAGTDYALLLVARYREELRRHEDRHEAMAVALHRAGPAIIASAGTVVVGMLCLLVAETNSTAVSARSRRSASRSALAVMITLLPALLVIVGRWVFWPVRPHVGSSEPTTTGLLGPGRRRDRPPRRATWIVTALLLAALAVGIAQLNATGLTNKDSFRGNAGLHRR